MSTETGLAHHHGDLRDLATRLRTLQCDHPDITILGHDLARRIEMHLKADPNLEPVPPQGAMPRFFLATPA
jgi:hypothetical protein